MEICFSFGVGHTHIDTFIFSMRKKNTQRKYLFVCVSFFPLCPKKNIKKFDMNLIYTSFFAWLVIISNSKWALQYFWFHVQLEKKIAVTQSKWIPVECGSNESKKKLHTFIWIYIHFVMWFLVTALQTNFTTKNVSARVLFLFHARPFQYRNSFKLEHHILQKKPTQIVSFVIVKIRISELFK